MKLRNFALSLGIFVLGMPGLTLAQGATVNDQILAGNQAYAAKDYAKAVDAYQNATKMDPNSAAAYQGLGNSYYGMGKKAEALAAYEKVLQINPNNPQVSAFAASLRAQLGTSPAPVAAATPVATAAPAAATATTASSTPATSTMTVPASTSASSSGTSNKFELDFGGGGALGLNTGYGVGFGGGIAGYYPLDKNFSIGASSAYYLFNFAYGNEGNLEVLGSMKVRADGKDMRPYFLVGAGISDYMSPGYSSTTTIGSYTFTITVPSSSSINPMVQGGAGVEFSADKDLNIFLQAKYSLVIGSGSTLSYVPFEGGLSFNL